MPPRPRRALRSLLVIAAALLAFLPGRAFAYPWMIHHGYTNCAQCHVDPSGAGILTDYGRAQGEILLRSHLVKLAADPTKPASFLFGAIPLPDLLEVQPDVRGLLIPEPGNVRTILMQADLRAALQAGPFVASGSLGVVSAGAEQAWITSSDTGVNLVSREYWAGVRPTRNITIKAGRMNLPFGIRTEDHILYVRSATGTTINDDQQVGLSVVYGSKKLRAELMGIAGNFQVRPDAFRKRGYSGYLSYSLSKTLEIGISSLLTLAQLDTETLDERTFMAHGVFGRGAPIEWLAWMVEADVMLDNRAGESLTGIATTAILDLEPTQGLHVQGIGEYCTRDFSDAGATAWSAGAGVQWFFAPRVDVRADAGYGSLFCEASPPPSPFALLQGHFYL